MNTCKSERSCLSLLLSIQKHFLQDFIILATFLLSSTRRDQQQRGLCRHSRCVHWFRRHNDVAFRQHHLPTNHRCERRWYCCTLHLRQTSTRFRTSRTIRVSQHFLEYFWRGANRESLAENGKDKRLYFCHQSAGGANNIIGKRFDTTAVCSHPRIPVPEFEKEKRTPVRHGLLHATNLVDSPTITPGNASRKTY